MRVSVIIPTYNYADTIGNAIESILQQDYSDIELIISDDGSTDNTQEIVQGYVNKYNNILYIKHENSGKAMATYRAYQISSGQIIFNLDADDVFLPGKISHIVNLYKSNSSISMIGHAAKIYIDGKPSGVEDLSGKTFVNKVINGKELVSFFLKNNILYGGGSTFSMRKSHVELDKKMAEVDMYVDEYLVYKACYAGDVLILSEPLSIWNIHGSNYSVGDHLSADKRLKKQLRLLKSSEGELDLLNQFIRDKIQVTFFKVKHLERVSFFYQKNSMYIKWLFCCMFIFGKLMKILLLGVNICPIIANYNIVKRFIPPFIYNTLRKSTPAH